MRTIFKSAVSQIHASNNMKAKTEEFLLEHLTAKSPVFAFAPEPAHPVIRKPIKKKALAIACTAFFVCAISLGAYTFYQMPTSYLSLDINPSVELGLNAFNKVVSTMAYNNDGKTILDGNNLMGSDIKSAVSTLVKSAVKKGFVAKNGSTVISVTAETDNSTTAKSLVDDAAQGADSAVKSEGDNASIQQENIALNKRDEARKLGVSPGKLNLIKKLQALDPSITVDEYKNAKVTDIMNKFVELKKKAHIQISCSSSLSPYSGINSYAPWGTYENAEASSMISEGSENFKTDEYTDGSSIISEGLQTPFDSSENPVTSSLINEGSETYSTTNESSNITSSHHKKRPYRRKSGKKSKSGIVSSITSSALSDKSSSNYSVISNESSSTSSLFGTESSSTSKITSSHPKKRVVKKKTGNISKSGNVSSSVSSIINEESSNTSSAAYGSSISKSTSSHPKKRAVKKKAGNKSKSGNVSSSASSTINDESSSTSSAAYGSSISKSTSSHHKKRAAKKKTGNKSKSGNTSSVTFSLTSDESSSTSSAIN